MHHRSGRPASATAVEGARPYRGGDALRAIDARQPFGDYRRNEVVSSI